MPAQIILRKELFSIIVFAFLMLISSFVADAQNAIDSLVSANDDKKMELVHQWYRQIRKRDDSSKVLLQLDQLQTKAKEENDRICLAAAEFYKGQYEAIEQRHHALGEKHMEEGIQIAEANGNILQTAFYRHHFGYYYFFEKKDYGLALRYMVRANHVFKKIGYDNIQEQGYHLYQLAFVYYHLRNYHESIKHLKTALQHPIASPISKIFVLNTIGQSYKKLYDLDSALHYFSMTYQFAQQHKDTTWMGISAGNIGSVYVLQHKFNHAEPYFQKFYQFSLISKDSSCISDALVSLAEVNLANGDIDQALKNLQEGESIYRTRFGPFGALNVTNENYGQQVDLYKNLSLAYELKNQPSEALRYLKMSNLVNDSLEKRALISGSVAIQQQLDVEQHMSELQLLEEEKENAQQRTYFLIALIGLSGVILFMVYNRRKLKTKKDQELREEKEALLQSEKRRVEEELNHSNQLLLNYTENLRQKSELLEQVQTEIKALRDVHGNNMEPQELYINSLNQSTILTDEEWVNFRQLFDKVHTGFFIRLREKYPDITPAETRLLALTKLKLSNKEMASMLGISTEAIKKTRQRLRKKISITEEVDMEELVEAI